MRLKILILIVFISFLFISNAFAQEVGKITALQGKVDILKGGKPPAVLAKINEPVYLNDIIRTKTDSRAEITFKDGTTVKIAPRSRVDISEYFTDAESFRVTLNVPRGKAGASVARESVEKIKASPKANRFEIKTPIAVAGVRGTNYIVAHYLTHSTVTVLTGRVYCYNSQFPERIVEVGAGQSTVIREGAPPAPPRRLTPGELQREQRDITLGRAEAPGEGRPESSFMAGFFEERPPVSGVPSEPQRFTPPLQRETTPPITETTGVTETLNIDVTLQSIEPGSINLNYKVSANRDVTVQYRIKQDGNYGNWVDVNTTPQNLVYFSAPVLEGHSYQIEVKATDSYGNTREWTSDGIYPLLHSLSGNIKTDTEAGSTVTGSVAGVEAIDKGVAKLTVSSPVSFNSTYKAGGGDSETGYWLLKGPSSSSYFRLLTPSYLFKGSGVSSVTLLDGGLKSITTGSWIETKPLNLSSKFTGYDHYWAGNKIDEVPGAGQAVVFTGRTGQLLLPQSLDETVTYNTENYGIGYIPAANSGPSMTWGIFQENSGSTVKLKGYAGGIGEETAGQHYAFYGLYIGSDNSAGIIKGLPYGANQNLYEEIRILDIEPSLTFKKKTTGYSTMNTWSNYIEGYYQGFFTGGGGIPTISQQNINTTSYGFIGSATLSLKKGDDIEPWGVFGIELGGSHSATSPTGFILEFGGDSWDNRDASSSTPDYWVGSIQGGTVSSGKMLGTFHGRFMTPTHYGTMEGKMFGDLGSDRWVGIVLGSYEPKLALSHLSNIVSDANTSKIYKENFSATGARINAYLGGDSFWSSSSASLYSIGKIATDPNNEVDFSQGKGYLWYAPISWSSTPNLYAGYIAGRFAQKTDTTYNMAAYVAGIYNDSTNKGIFIGNLSTDGTSNVLTLEERFFLEGENTVKAVTLKEGAIFPSEATISSLSIDTNPYDMGIANYGGYIIRDTNGYTIGAGLIGMGGTYNTSPSGLWEITYTGKWDGSGAFGAILKGDVWGTENNIQNIIHGKTYGYFLDDTGIPIVTGIFVGETAGTFDPTKWQTITAGVVLETGQFLSMACPGGSCNKSGSNFTEEQEKLRKLNIPVVEVGKASFSYTGSCENCLTEVNMNNVVFFSTQVGQKPVLWSTANITGAYSGTPTLNQAVTLSATSGASGSVNFSPTSWSSTPSNNWTATVAGSVTLSGYSYSVNMQGAAGGSYNGGSFSGTASGIVK